MPDRLKKFSSLQIRLIGVVAKFFLCLCEALALLLNFATPCVAQVVYHNPAELYALANYAQAPIFATTQSNRKLYNIA